MASGRILGNCPVCEDFVWEDDYRFFDNIMIHPKCVPDYIKAKRRKMVAMEKDKDYYIKRCQEAEEWIEKLEWSYPGEDQEGNRYAACPVCFRFKQYGHADDCKLKQFLGGESNAGS
jgi:hypothetical protein